MKMFVASMFVILASASVVKANPGKSKPDNKRKVASVDALIDLIGRCDKAGGVSDQIDCYQNIIETSAAVYPSSKFAKIGNVKQFQSSYNGAKAMCELGTLFMNSGMSGSDQCLLNASKTIATYVVAILSKPGTGPFPFAPTLGNN